MYCTVFLPNESEIEKDMQSAGRHYSDMVEKKQKWKKEVRWLFNAMLRPPRGLPLFGQTGREGRLSPVETIPGGCADQGSALEDSRDAVCGRFLQHDESLDSAVGTLEHALSSVYPFQTIARHKFCEHM